MYSHPKHLHTEGDKDATRWRDGGGDGIQRVSPVSEEVKCPDTDGTAIAKIEVSKGGKKNGVLRGRRSSCVRA